MLLLIPGLKNTAKRILNYFTVSTSGSLVSKGDAVSGILSREAGEDVGVYAIRKQVILLISNNYRISFVEHPLQSKALF